MPIINGAVNANSTPSVDDDIDFNPAMATTAVPAGPAASGMPAASGAVAESSGMAPISTYQAENINVNEDTDTVEGRVQSIINKGGPLQQIEETNARQAMNAKGTLNSSMATEAEAMARYKSAVPIATTDATNILKSKASNIEANNAAAAFNSGAINQEQLQQLVGAQAAANIAQKGTLDTATAAQLAETNTAQTAQQGDIELAKIDADALAKQEQTVLQGQIDTGLQQLDAQMKIDLENLDAENATQLQGLMDANKVLLETTRGASTMFATSSQAIGQILSNPDITASSKQSLIKHEVNLLNSGLSVLTGMTGINTSGILDFNNPDAVSGQMTTEDLQAMYAANGWSWTGATAAGATESTAAVTPSTGSVAPTGASVDGDTGGGATTGSGSTGNAQPDVRTELEKAIDAIPNFDIDKML